MQREKFPDCKKCATAARKIIWLGLGFIPSIAERFGTDVGIETRLKTKKKLGNINI